MDDDPFTVNIQQTDLIGLDRSKPGKVEFLPEVWDAAEALTSPDLEIRSFGLKRLVESDAVRYYPLIAYLLYTRLNEPDIELRTRIVDALSSVFAVNGNSVSQELNVYPGLTYYLSQMRTRQIYSLLQVVDFDHSAEAKVASLLEHCSYAGEHLAEILADRHTPLSIRKQAIHFIDRMGYLDALPVLERLEARLTQRRNGREEYGESIQDDECSLLPMIRSALENLTAL
ncbi:MAG: hypothetical protein QME21_16835 [Anaerolineales bacterium]|mgnify:CR=1 FL=1|jgi:hypothetical protein|nr:hypothetical protein [Anaerolineales bacterium]